MIKWKSCNLKEFLGMCINYNYKNQKIFVDQFEYLDKVLIYFNIATNLISTPLLSSYMFKPKDK